MEAFSNEAADDSRELMDQLAVENRERYDYRKFLRKFSVLKETVQIDPDAFDYVFYNYGMQLYGNMPLIDLLRRRKSGGSRILWSSSTLRCHVPGSW